ncbi:hypothetical protein niasHS_010801 [Heterodera schachtii]|uniref:Uncharacterized protein n=1 Tax=Heterodera schachtii TaxID=97005 RepID=A0ABD2ISL4_HETSC
MKGFDGWVNGKDQSAKRQHKKGRKDTDQREEVDAMDKTALPDLQTEGGATKDARGTQRREEKEESHQQTEPSD